MALPVETAQQTRRLLLEICQDHMRKSVDSLREVVLLLNAFQRGKSSVVMQHYNNVTKFDEESTEIKRALMREAAQVGMILLSREDFIRLSSEIATVADFCEGVSFRLVEMVNKKWKASADLVKDLGHLAEATLDCVSRLRETVLSLSYGATKTLDLAKNVETAERNVDSIYRKLDLKIMSSNLKLPAILMLRDIANFLEGIADVCENANDIAKILAITV
ncbi:MAG: DUF47 domain-containing protein [Candidatus Bathyarchaeia archaeon]